MAVFSRASPRQISLLPLSASYLIKLYFWRPRTQSGRSEIFITAIACIHCANYSWKNIAVWLMRLNQAQCYIQMSKKQKKFSPNHEEFLLISLATCRLMLHNTSRTTLTIDSGSYTPLRRAVSRTQSWLFSSTEKDLSNAQPVRGFTVEYKHIYTIKGNPQIKEKRLQTYHLFSTDRDKPGWMNNNKLFPV